MKKYITKDRFKGLKKEEYLMEVAKAYQEVLNFLSGAIGMVSMSDEPLLAAAMEAFADALKKNMRKTELGIYEEVKKLKVTGIGVTKRNEE